MTLTEVQTTLAAEVPVKQEQGLQELVYNLVTKFLAENKSKTIDDLYDMIYVKLSPHYCKWLWKDVVVINYKQLKCLGLAVEQSVKNCNVTLVQSTFVSQKNRSLFEIYSLHCSRISDCNVVFLCIVQGF